VLSFRHSPPEHHPCPCLGLLGLYGFFSHAWIILNLRTACGSLSDYPSSSTRSAAFHQRFLHGDFRITPYFTFSRPPPTTFPHGGFWDPARRRVGWVRQEVVSCYTAGRFSLFLFLFFANFLFCNQVTILYLPCRRTRPPSPSRAQEAPLLTATATPHLALSPHPHAPHRRALACAMSPYPHRVTVIALAYPLLVRFLFLFSANTLLQSSHLSLPSSPTDARSSPPSRAYHGATTNRDDNDGQHHTARQ
jgi:hypothetical protein